MRGAFPALIGRGRGAVAPGSDGALPGAGGGAERAAVRRAGPRRGLSPRPQVRPARPSDRPARPRSRWRGGPAAVGGAAGGWVRARCVAGGGLGAGVRGPAPGTGRAGAAAQGRGERDISPARSKAGGAGQWFLAGFSARRGGFGGARRAEPGAGTTGPAACCPRAFCSRNEELASASVLPQTEMGQRLLLLLACEGNAEFSSLTGGLAEKTPAVSELSYLHFWLALCFPLSPCCPR